jgi:PncC family amidohydrolase
MSNAQLVVEALKRKGLIITTVESCTGGCLASAITDIPGASEVLNSAFVVYSNEAKVALGVPKSVLDRYSVYSNECAVEMAAAGLIHSLGSRVSVGITGNLDRVDPANPEASQCGVVYVAILWQDGPLVTERSLKSTSLTLQVVDGVSRWANKLFIVNAVMRTVLDMLEVE